VETVYKILRDIGIELASINDSASLLKQATKAACDLIKAQEAYALLLDENGRFQIIYSNAPTPKSIEALRTEIARNECGDDCTTCFNTEGFVCIRLSADHIIHLISDEYSPKQNEILELFGEQTAPQLRSILQHEKTVAELHVSKDRYRNLLSSLHEGIWVINAEANTTFVNENMAKMLGYTIEQMLGKRLFSFMDEEGVEIANNNLSRREQGIEEQHPFKFLGKDGQVVYTLIETSPIIENGEYAGAVAGVMDITEREHRLNELRYNEKRFRDIVEATNDWVWEVDVNGVYTYSNKAITNLFGYTPEEIVGKTPFDLMMPEEAERVGNLLAKIKAQRAPFTHLWNVNKHKNGKHVFVSTTGTPILDDDGELLGYRGMNRDVSMLAKQKEDRAKARRQTQLLLSVISGISEAPNFQVALEVGLRLVSDHANWVYSEAWIMDSRTGRLFNHAQFFPPEHKERLINFSALSWDTTFALEEGVPGWTWVSQETAWYENIQTLPSGMYLRLKAAKKVDLKAALAVPAVVNGETMAVLMFYADIPHEKESEAMQLITAVASQLGLILQQKQTQETVRKLSRAVEQSAASIFITDLNGFIEFVNPAFTKISGYHESEVFGKNPSLLRSKNTPKSIYKALWTALQEGGTWEGRMENRCKDGTSVWVQSSISVIKDSHDNSTHYLCIQTDITEQMASETALQASEEQNRALIQAIPDMIFLFNKDGIYLDSYGSQEKFLLAPEAFIGKSVVDIMASELAEQTLSAIKTTLDTGKTTEFNYKLSLGGESSVGYYEARLSKTATDHALALIRDVTSEHLANEALQDSEATNRALVEAIPDIMFLLDSEGVLLDNYGIEEGLLLPPEEFINKNIRDIVPPDICELSFTAMETALRTGETQQYSYALSIGNNLSTNYYDARIVVVKDSRLLMIIHDVTTQRRAETALQESQHNLAKAQELSHLGSREWDIKSGKVFWSDETYRILGYQPQSFESTYAKFLEMMHPGDVEGFKTTVQDCIDTHEPYFVVYRIKRASGEIRYIQEQGEVICNKDGDAMRIIAAALDITEQVIAQQKIEAAMEAAQQSEQKLARAQSIAHLGNWEWDEESKTILWSDETYRMAGYEPQSFVVTQAKFLAMLHPDDVKAEKTAVKESLISGKPYVMIYRLKRPSGEIRYMEERGKPIRTNSTLHLIGTVLDITEQVVTRQKLEQASKVAQKLQIEAERANRAKSIFLTNMSHELRTPLNGILGYTQLFKQDDSLSSQQLHGIDVIHRSGEHLLFMINDMLDLAKIESGKMTLNVTEYHLPDTLTSLVNMVSQLAQQKGIAFSHYLAAGLPQTIMTDGVRLRQVLLNLLSNAVKFTESGSVLFEVLPIQTAVLSANPSTIKIRFRVEDTGIGIAPGMLKPIFSPFEQVSTAKDSINGTGLGLAISQRLTSLLGGTLKVSSRLGEGSIFWFDLEFPAVHGTEIDVENTNSTIAPISGVQGSKKLRLLIVDDVKSNRFIISRYFSALSGFDIMEAHDGEDAVAKATVFKPHLTLMDLRMPIMDGLEATRQIRLLPALANSIIIALSADAYINIEEELSAVGFDGFLIKPIKLAQLLEQIRMFLGNEWKWLYAQKQTETTMAKTAVIVPLPEEETAVLLELARNGDIKSLRDTLSLFKQQLSPQYSPIVEQLTQLARQYRIKQIRELLEKQT